MSAAVLERPAGRYDAARRRRVKRSGKEKGGWVYIPQDELDKTGFGGDQPAPFYRVWGSDRGSVMVRLYREA